MGFYYSKSKTKLPLRGCKKLPFRGPRKRRLQLLKDFQPGRVYTFIPFYELDELPEDLLLWADEAENEVNRDGC